jgi:hypothetical protein
MFKNSFFSNSRTSVLTLGLALVSVISLGIFTQGCSKEDIVVNDNMEYIDIPEAETDPLWFMNETLNKKHMTAFHRFNSKIDLVNGFIKVKINKGKDINISEQLFEKFCNGVIQTNQGVKEGKYKLAKEDDNIVIVSGINRKISRLKNGVENGNDDRVQLNQSSQAVGTAMVAAYKRLVQSPSGTYDYLNDLINMASGNFGGNVYLRSGSFTFQGYTFRWMVSDYCTFHGQPQNCWANQIASYTYLNANSGIAIQNGSGNISALTTTQPGAWAALEYYLYH